MFTFGSGTYGQLGHGSKNNEILPRKVMELMGSEVTQLASGRFVIYRKNSKYWDTQTSYRSCP